MAERKFGTKEWSDVSVNIQVGCRHDCVYCYAREIALRYGRIKCAEDWKNPVVRNFELGKRRKKESGVIMYPTTHDLHFEEIELHVQVLKNLLISGNQVLIVSKANVLSIKKIVEELSQWKEQLELRVTIGAFDDAILSAWEPGAPKFEERFESLKFAHKAGWKTSVSIEPMLDAENIEQLVSKLESFVTETIWIGKLNKIDARCNDATFEMKQKIRLGQTDKKILDIVEKLRGNLKIRWKESVVEVLDRFGVVA